MATIPLPSIPHKVFLSYGHDEACGELVQRIRSDLESRGIEVWVDHDRIEFGDDWRRAITDGLKTSTHVLAFLSKHSTRKPGVCRQEVAIALGPLKSHVYTVLVEPLSEVTPPLIISNMQWLDMQHWRSLKATEPFAYEALYQNSLAEILRVLELNEPFAGEIEELQRWLKPLDCTSDMIAAEDGFTGREWLLGDVGEALSVGNTDTNTVPTGEIERWRTDGSPRKVFWITAEPGWGKSAVSARLAHAGRARVMAVHFCKHDQPDRRDARRVVRSIVFQMATQLGEYRSLLVDEARRGTTLDDKNAKELFQSLLADMLTHVIEGGRGPHDRHLIVIDALDEAVDADGRSDLLALVSGEFGKLPSWLGLVVTSRPEAPVMRQLGHFGVQALKAEDPRNLQDVHTYAQAWLHGLPQDNLQCTTALRRVMQASQGNFLYLRQLKRAVLEGIIQLDQLTQEASLPKGLASLYERWFLHRFADPIAYQRTQRPLLELMLAAREPLPLDLAGNLLNWGAYGQDEVIEPLGSLCVRTETEDTTGGTITFFHKSLRDWVADAQAAGRLWRASEAEGHRVLAAGLWQAYLAWSDAGAGLEQNEGFEELGAAGQAYALRHLPAHLKETKRTKDLDVALTDFGLAMRRCMGGALEHLLEDYRNERNARGNSSIQAWADCIGTNAHILRRGLPEWPTHKILLQVATEHADDSAVTVTAEKWLQLGHCDWVWMRRKDRQQQYAPNPCLLVLEGHTSFVNGARLLPDGCILSWSNDQTLRLWDGRTGVPLTVLTGHAGSVEGAEVLGDGRILSWSTDGTFLVWDSKSGGLLRGLKCYLDGVMGAEALSDGRILSWLTDGSLFLWDSDSADVLTEMEGHSEAVYRAEVLPDGRILSQSRDDTLRLWDGRTGAELAVLGGHTGGIFGAEVLPDGRILSWGDGDLRLWDGHTGATLTVMEGHRAIVFGATFQSNGRILSWSLDRTLRIWDGQSGAALAVMVGHGQGVSGAKILPDGRILSWSLDDTLRLWNGQSGAELAVMECPEIRGAEILPDDRILSWSLDGTLRLWDSLSGQPLVMLEGHTEGVMGAEVLPDGRILSWSSEASLRLWDGRSGSALPVLKGNKGKARAKVSGAVFLSEVRRPSWLDRTVLMNDRTRGGKRAGRAVLKGYSHMEGTLALPSGRILSSSYDETLRLWDGQSGAELAVLKGHTGKVSDAEVLPDGRILSWSHDGTLRLWDGLSGEPLVMLEGHTAGVTGAEVLPDGRILSWAWDKTLRLWDCQSGAALAVMMGHTGTVSDAEILSDGRILSWSSEDSTLRLWDGQSGAGLDCMPANWVETTAFPGQWQKHAERSNVRSRGNWWAQAIGRRISIADTATGYNARWQANANASLAQTATGLLCAKVGNKQIFLETWQGAQPFSLVQ